ncbi:MAG: hypothetical protein ACI8RD_011153 [Bacillariaceae sp.]|jgi:hypothetical protein
MVMMNEGENKPPLQCIIRTNYIDTPAQQTTT